MGISETGRGLGYVPALDGLRGVAIALVLTDHVGWLPGGFLGVDVFFVLSGFLITTLLLEEWDRGLGIRLRSFYARRARRLLPAAYALFAVLGVLVALELSAGRTTTARQISESMVVCALYVANIWRATGHLITGPLTPMWSLAEEEQFYLVWPPLLIVALRCRIGLGRLACLLAAVVIALGLWRAHFAAPGQSLLRPDMRADPLLVGCALAALRHSQRLPRVPAFVAGAALVVLAADVWLCRSAAWTFTFRFGVPLAALASAAVIAAAVEGGALAHVLSFRPLVRLGVISYGVYVWHALIFYAFSGNYGPFLELVRCAAIAVSVAVAAISYRYVERPFRTRVQHALPRPAASHDQRLAEASL